MKGWMRKLGLGALALSLAVAVGGCDDGGGGSGLIRIFFGINGDGDCSRVVVTVDLDEANAVVATDEFGAAQCVLDSALAGSGCLADFDLEGDILTVVIDNCTIPEVAALFSCLFERGVNLVDLDAASVATCECAGPGCDETPPLCIDGDPDPSSCEDCDDNIDNDGDGLVDCDDPVCENTPPCGGFDTTTTSTTTTISDTTTTLPPTTSTLPTTTTTSTSTTTSVTLPPAFDCNVIFAVEDEGDFGSLQWDTDYADAPGGFAGSGGDVECASLVSGSIASFNDKENEQVLTSGIISLDGFAGPADLAECTFNAAVPPVPEDFDITVTDAADPDINPVVPTPVVFVRQIDCTGGGTTTTLPVETTTTTVDTVTTTLGPTTTTTMGGGGIQEVSFFLDDNRSFGALQFTASYDDATGNFVSDGGNVQCTASVSGVLPAFNDDTANRDLGVGIIALAGFSGPTEVASCLFDGTPVPSDFVITVDDASDPSLNPIDTATVDITVTVAPAP